MKFADYKLGYADAARELLLEPDIFKDAFYDPFNNVDKLLNSWKFMLVGRKGVGKSAYCSKIQYIAKKQGIINAFVVQLDDFEYATFSKASCDSMVEGTKKYLDAWNFLILLQVYKILYGVITEVPEFTEMIELLEKIGFSVKTTFKSNVVSISKLKVGGNVGVFDAECEMEIGQKPLSFTERLGWITNRMISVLEKTYINTRLYLLIDGVDDLLRLKKNQVEILSSLIRSVNKLNTIFVEKKINIKNIIFLREDILAKASDPDINKIKRDGSIPLSWSSDTDDLKKIANLRLGLSSDNTVDNLFAGSYDSKQPWDAILEHTLYKPRDILEFLRTCQTLYPNEEKLTVSQIRKALKKYSSDYFIEEMKNELSGYVSDEIIAIVPTIFQKIGSNRFTTSSIVDAVKPSFGKNRTVETDVRQLLLVLFEAGYIGQLVKTNRNTDSVVFKYRNPTASIDYSQSFLIHRGIQKGLGVII